MNTHEEAAQAIREMLVSAMNGHREGILTTVSAEGRPHACWMGAVSALDYAHLITVTGSHTDKVAHIMANPLVEWMFASSDRHTIIYFEGSADILVDENMKRRYFDMVPEESRCFFTKYYHAGGDWCVINTHIESAVYCVPEAYMKVRIPEHIFSPGLMERQTTVMIPQGGGRDLVVAGGGF